MAHFTGYLLGKVQLDGAIRSEVLASLVETLVQKHQTSESSKKSLKFNENHKYSVECSERGLKLTSPGRCRSKDEGFESDCESIRSVKINETVELDLSNLIDHLEITEKDEKETDSGAQLHSSPSSPGGSMDSTSMTSSSGLHVSDDNNSSSGNGSDSDEFGASGDRSPYWETLPNLSSFQSYLIEDVVFCHCDSLHPFTLVWVVRHLEKMIALVTAFRTRSEAEELFQTYRDLRVKLKPVKYKLNPILGLKIHNHSLPPPGGNCPAPSPPSETSSSCVDTSTFTSLPPVYPTEILHETHQSKSSTLFSYEPKSLGFQYDVYNSHSHLNDNASTTSTLTREPLSRQGSNSLSLHTHVYVSNPNILRHGNLESIMGRTDEGEDESNGSSEDNTEESEESSNNSNNNKIPQRPQRKVYGGGTMTIASSSGGGKSISSSTGTLTGGNNNNKQTGSTKPVLLVPLKTESVSAPSTYPKESYLYHVMGRSSSTFAPYQRSLNFLPHQYGSNGGGDYMAWGNGGGGHLLVPFSSWLELSEMPKIPHAVNNNGSGSSRKPSHYLPKGRASSRNNMSRISGSIGAKGTTSKILLRDAAGRDSMWASLSQRFKRNVRENLIPKLNGMWSQPTTENGRKKRTNKKVTFNAWATVQMV